MTGKFVSLCICCTVYSVYVFVKYNLFSLFFDITLHYYTLYLLIIFLIVITECYRKNYGILMCSKDVRFDRQAILFRYYIR